MPEDFIATLGYFFVLLRAFIAAEELSIAGLENSLIIYFFFINIHFTVILNFTLIPVNLTVKNDCLTLAVNLRLDPIHVYACMCAHRHTERHPL